MKRIARYILSALTLLSLLLCAAVCVLWARSYQHIELAILETSSRSLAVSAMSERGAVRLAIAEYHCQRGTYGPAMRSLRYDLAGDVELTLLEMVYGKLVGEPQLDRPWVGSGAADFQGARSLPPPRPPDYEYRYVVAPHWLLTALAASLPALRGLRGYRAWHQARRRARTGLCQSCGYDLRATPGRCPECGAVPKGAGA